MKTRLFSFLMLITVSAWGQIADLQFQDDDFDTEELLENLNFQNLDEVKATAQRLMKRADMYYDRMWYAQASELYDQVRSLTSDKEWTKRLLERGGDSYYYISALDSAYDWFDPLYNRYGSQLSEAQVYRFVHVLKGTGHEERADELLYQLSIETSSETNYESHTTFMDMMEEGTVSVVNLPMNSPMSDFSPIFYQKDQMVFSSSRDSSFLVSRKYKWNNQPYLDLYIGKRDSMERDVENVKKLSPAINTKYHEASASFSPDGQTVYFTRNNYKKKLRRDDDGVNHLTLFRSVKENGKWSRPKELPFNSKNYSTGHPAVSPDGKKLYFVSDMPGGLGGTDIYVVDIYEDGEYSKPRNLGTAVNSRRKEMFPYVSGNALYFSSNRSDGYGGLDVYQSNYRYGEFDLAVNLGEPINSRRDDFSFIIDEEKKSGYFASNRPGGKGSDDIYSFTNMVEPAPIAGVISGRVIDQETGEILIGAEISLVNDQNRIIRKEVSNEEGVFRFEDLDRYSSFTIQTSLASYKQSTQDAVWEVKTEQTLAMEVPLEKDPYVQEDFLVQEDGDLRLKNDRILFAFDSYRITRDSKEILDEMVQVFLENPGLVVRIDSHTDSRGSNQYNQWLSEKRAESTRDYLLSQGVNPAQIADSVGHGEDDPQAKCTQAMEPCEENLHKQNRRSVFEIVSWDRLYQ